MAGETSSQKGDTSDEERDEHVLRSAKSSLDEKLAGEHDT
jgi:hypothetical protein